MESNSSTFLPIEPKPPKLRAKEFRERKKQYLEYLESQVLELKTEVAALKEENARLKAQKCSEKQLSLEQKLFEDEKYAYENMYQAIKYTMIGQEWGQIGNFGDSRVKLIKACFNTVLENILPLDVKVTKVLIDQVITSPA